MPNFWLKFSILIILAALVFASFLPLSVKAQTLQSSAQESFLRTKIQLLKLQIELMKAQISLLLKSALAAEVNCAQVSLSWERVSGANGYRLYRDGNLVYEGNARSFVDSGLTLGKRYTYVVYGVRGGVEGEPSEVKEITAPKVCPPQTPQLSFQAEPCGGNITLTWSPLAGAAVYQVFRGSREVYEGPLTKFVDSRLRPGSTYEYKIRAGSSGGWGDFSAPVNFQASNVCAPSEVEVSSAVPEVVREGLLLTEMKKSPTNNTRIKLKTDLDAETRAVSRSVMAFGVKASFSDITITRIDLFFDSPVWLYLDKIAIRFGGRTVAEKEVSQESFTRIGSEHVYQLRFEGLSSIVKDDKKGTFTVRVTTKESFPGPLPRNITVFLENNSIRGIDQAGIQQIAPVSGGGKEGVFSRTFRIE